MTKDELAARPKSGKGSATTRVPDPSQMSVKGMTYVHQKVAEVLTGKPKPSAYAYPLVYGKETEPEAVAFFENKFGIQTEESGFVTFGDHAGGSPDRLIGDSEGLEVKCPFYSEHQINYLMLTDHYDLKANYPEYYWQVVSLLLFCDRKKWHFCTFDPRMIDDKHKLTHLVIEWNQVEEDIDFIIKALEGAVKEKLQTINLLK
jgi:hypothetical protein